MFKFILSVTTSVSLLTLYLETSHASYFDANNNNNAPVVARTLALTQNAIGPRNHASLIPKSKAQEVLTMDSVIVEDEEINDFIAAKSVFISSPNYMDCYKKMFAQGVTFFDQFKQTFPLKKETSAYCLALLQSYILEWKILVTICEQYFGDVTALQGRIIENNRILDHIRENSSSFPKNRKAHIALVDGLSSQRVNDIGLDIFMEPSTTNKHMLNNWEQGLQEVSSRLAPIREELSNPLKTGVEAFKKFLKEENTRHALEISPLVVEYKKYAERLQLIAVELGTESMRELMTRALIILSGQINDAESQIRSIEDSSTYTTNIREIHEDIRWLKDRVNNRRDDSPILKVFYAAFDQPWHELFKRYTIFKDEVTKMFDRGIRLDNFGAVEADYNRLQSLSVKELIEFYNGKCISELFSFYNNQEVLDYLINLKNDSNAPLMLQSMNRSLEKLELWRSWHQGANEARSVLSVRSEQKDFINGMGSLATSKNEESSFLVKKAVSQTDAIDFLIANHSREQLWKAYEDLKSDNRTQAILQIVRHLVEEKVTGFAGEAFTRWILVTFVMPNLVPSAQELLDMLVVKIAQKLGVDSTKPFEQVVMVRNNNQADTEVVREFTTHFPGVPELQRTRGILGDDLICIIKNLPVDFFGEFMHTKVENVLAGRDNFLKEKGANLSQAIVKKVSKILQRVIVDAIRKYFAAPSLMTISDPKLEDHLRARIGEEDGDSISELNNLKLKEQNLADKLALFGSDKTTKGAELVKKIDAKVQNAAQAVRMVERLNFGFRLLNESIHCVIDPAYACTQLFAAASVGLNLAADYALKVAFDDFEDDSMDGDMDQRKDVAPAELVQATDLRALFLELIHAQDQFRLMLNGNESTMN